MTVTTPRSSPVTPESLDRHRVVVIGSGFGGLWSTEALAKAPVDITMISGTSHHLFQPLLYQVATGVLSEGEVAPATREVLKDQDNVTVLLGRVTEIDLDARTVTSLSPLGTTVTPYDSLIVAAGAGQSYFGNDHFAEFAPGMKSIDDALELRGRIFGSFELAELCTDPAETEEWLTFVVVGAGPTGVEMAGQIAELAHRTLRRDFRRIDTKQTRVILLDAAPAVLGAFGDKLSAAAAAQLQKIGVDVQLNVKVVGVDNTGVDVIDPDGTERRIKSRCKVWAAGVSASPLGSAVGRPERGRGRPGRPGDGERGSEFAGPTGGFRGRRHDRVEQSPRRRAGGDAGRQARGRSDHPPARRGGDRSAVQVLRQGQHGHDLALPRRGQCRQQDQDGRVPGLADVAGGARHVPGGVQESLHHDGALGGRVSCSVGDPSERQPDNRSSLAR